MLNGVYNIKGNSVGSFTRSKLNKAYINNNKKKEGYFRINSGIYALHVVNIIPGDNLAINNKSLRLTDHSKRPTSKINEEIKTKNSDVSSVVNVINSDEGDSMTNKSVIVNFDDDDDKNETYISNIKK